MARWWVSFSEWAQWHRKAIVAMGGALVLLILYRRFRRYAAALVAVSRDQVLLQQQANSFLAPIKKALASENKNTERDLRLKLAAAGFSRPEAMTLYASWQATGLLIGGAVALLALLNPGPILQKGILAFCAVFIGYKGPELMIESIGRGRRDQIAKALPTWSDLMVLCLEVGLSIEAAFERVGAQLQPLSPIFSSECEFTQNEMRAGLTFGAALARMAERVGLEDLNNIARLVGQASSMGGSISKTLRDYSEAAAVRRMAKAEEKAGKIASLMVLPMAICLLPATMIVLMGPSIIISISTMDK